MPNSPLVVLVGLFSAKDKQYGRALDLLAAEVVARGGRVVGRHVQRRGVSHGGAARMNSPFSRRTLVSPGKAREIAQACRAAGVDVAVFANPLTNHQRAVLTELLGCVVMTGSDVSSAPATVRIWGSVAGAASLIAEGCPAPIPAEGRRAAAGRAGGT